MRVKTQDKEKDKRLVAVVRELPDGHTNYVHCTLVPTSTVIVLVHCALDNS